jgi:hypothetical protein
MSFGKKCQTCNQTKPRVEFGARPNNLDGKNNSCKSCIAKTRLSVADRRKKDKELHQFPKLNDIVKDPPWRDKKELAARERAAEAI